MDEPRGQIQGPVSEADGDEGEPPFVAQVVVRRLGLMERVLLWGMLLGIGIVLLVVMLPVAILVMVGVVAYVTAAVVKGMLMRVGRRDSLERERRNVRVRGRGGE